jgi:hypothetical protein
MTCRIKLVDTNHRQETHLVFMATIGNAIELFSLIHLDSRQLCTPFNFKRFF